jgi:hypothetical protein
MKLIQRISRASKERVQFYLSDVCAVSFPKSGRTWTRSYLASYLSILYNKDLGYEFCPVWGWRNRKAPRIFFTHAKHVGENKKESATFLKKFDGKKGLLIVRDPKDVVFSYYCRLLKREQNAKAMDLSFSDFVRHNDFGVPRIVRFMNEWVENREVFSTSYVLRYESLVEDPLQEFEKLLEFLAISVNKEIVKQAYSASVDTTRKIEQGSLEADEQVRIDISKGQSYFEAKVGPAKKHKQYVGNESLLDQLMAKEDEDYIREEIEKLNKIFLYR